MQEENTHKFLAQVEKTKKFLKGMGLDLPPNTAERYTKLLMGISKENEVVENINRGVFKSDFGGMVIEKDIPIFSYCSHHILPWFGQVHIGYIAHEKVLGISKFTRIVNYYSAGLTIQEDITHDIANFFVQHLSEGVVVVVEAIHTCKVARGVMNPFSRSVTIDARGAFMDKDGPRIEFFSILGTTRSQH